MHALKAFGICYFSFFDLDKFVAMHSAHFQSKPNDYSTQNARYEHFEHNRNAMPFCLLIS